MATRDVTPKSRRKAQRKARVAAREAAWIERYERGQAIALGDPNYRMPGGRR